ncbi:glycerophosphodiester phosphodiesterase [Microvirga puerhi]|uniref:GP-PDE domain-containing protein n=1 Tax=Microvirga puerhi TaxID=2876078 RepID=A0ABS7VUQ9_9HYPH|nr:glycerophosphodiester phosphodiesterase family protein [Microvirga puerhi]MBZ6078682.1 hypothetical protein [Microvirga puerhi]
MKIIAHRGYSARYTENTLSAYHAAIDVGCDMIEADARLSADGIIFCTHDANLTRIAGQNIEIAATCAQDLRGIRLIDGERLATLEDVIAECGARIPILVDVKTTDTAVIDAIVRVVRASGAKDIWVGVRAVTQCERLSILAPSVPVLAFLPRYEDAAAFQVAGARAFRVWEGDLAAGVHKSLPWDRPFWVTTGGRGTNQEVGDTDEGGLATVAASGAEAILMNDPFLARQSLHLATVSDKG